MGQLIMSNHDELPEIKNIQAITSNDADLPSGVSEGFDSNYSKSQTLSKRSSETGHHDPRIGKVLRGTYTLQKKIGEGGMGFVYLALQAPLDREVAIKMLKPSEANKKGQHYFMREVKAINMLRHPNIVSIVDFGQEPDGTLFLVMEHLPGTTLKRVIRHEFPLDPKRVCRICIQVLSALEQAHQSGVIHCDLKPGNIMLENIAGEKDFAKVLDFGIAKVKGSTVEVGPYTQAGNIVGTFDYMSPEQIMRKELDGRADIWSMGVILFEMLTRQRIFHDKDAVSIIGRVMQMQIKRPSELVNPKYNAKIPAVLEDIALRALSRNIDQRFVNAADMRNAFQKVLNDLGSLRNTQPNLPRAFVKPTENPSPSPNPNPSPNQSNPQSSLAPQLVKSSVHETSRSFGNIHPQNFSLGDSQRLATGIAAGTSILDQTFSIEELQSSLTGERRKVAILAIQHRVQGKKGIDPEELARRSKNEIEIIQARVRHHNGHIDSFLGGTYIVLFGSKETRVGDAHRAMQCALALQKKFRALASGATHLGFGLTYGEIYISDKSGGNSFGSPIDFAVEVARGSTQSEIFIDENLYNLTRDRGLFGETRRTEGEEVFQLLAFEEKVKNVSQHKKIDIYVPRPLQYNELARHFSTVKKKRGGGVAILGPSGIGKSTFLKRSLLELQKSGANVFFVKSTDIENKKSLGLIRAWIRKIAKSYSDPKILIEKAAKSMGVVKNTNSLADLYISGKWSGTRIDLPWNDNQSFIYFTSALLHRMIRFAMRKGPVILATDDLSDKDESTRKILDVLLEAISTQPVLILISRTFDATLEHDHGLLGNFEILNLNGFSLDQTRAFITESLGQRPPVEIVERLFEKSGGNPSYLYEMLLKLQQSSTTQILSIDKVKDLVPLSLRELLAQRVDHLKSDARDLLAIASVLGESFREESLYQVAPAHLGAKIALPELITQGFLEAHYDAFGEVHISFTPRSLRDIVYTRLPNASKTQFHTSIITLLESAPELAASNPIEWAMTLAFHYHSIASYENSASYLGRSAELMNNNYDFIVALKTLEEASGLLRKHGYDYTNKVVSQIFIMIISTARSAGRLDIALKYIQEIQDINQLPSLFWASFLLEKGRLGGKGIPIMKAVSALEEVRNIATREGERILEIHALLALSSLFQEQNQLNHAGNLLIEIATKVDKIGELDLGDPEQRELIWTAYNQLGTLFIRQNKIEDAQKYLNIALARSKEIGDTRGIIRVLSNLGALCLTIRDVSTATEYFRRALVFAKSSGDLLNQAKILMNLGVSAFERQDLELSKSALREAKILAEEIGWTEGLVDIGLHVQRVKAAL